MSDMHIDTLYGSWVEVDTPNGLRDAASSSGLQGELESFLLEAQLEMEQYYRRSPPSQQGAPSPARSSGSPRPPSDPDSDCVTIQEETDRMPDTDWVWDWSSRLENVPLKELVFRHPRGPRDSLNAGDAGVMKRMKRRGGIFSPDTLLILAPSLVATHLLTLGIGVYIGMRLAASTSSSTM